MQVGETGHHLDRQHLRSLIRQARFQKHIPNKPPKAYREIFRILKDLAHADGSVEGSPPQDSIHHRTARTCRSDFSRDALHLLTF
ncbi:MAG: DUF615 domain-containing protein [Rhodanobacter sp.]